MSFWWSNVLPDQPARIREEMLMLDLATTSAAVEFRLHTLTHNCTNVHANESDSDRSFAILG